MCGQSSYHAFSYIFWLDMRLGVIQSRETNAATVSGHYFSSIFVVNNFRQKLVGNRLK